MVLTASANPSIFFKRWKNFRYVRLDWTRMPTYYYSWQNHPIPCSSWPILFSLLIQSTNGHCQKFLDLCSCNQWKLVTKIFKKTTTYSTPCLKKLSLIHLNSTTFAMNSKNWPRNSRRQMWCAFGNKHITFRTSEWSHLSN